MRATRRLPTGSRALSASGLMAALAMFLWGAGAGRVCAQGTAPALTDANLTVRSFVTGLTQPTGIAFMAPNDLFVIEKSTGRVRRFLNGVDRGTVLDLAVNNASERGLLGIALDPTLPITTSSISTGPAARRSLPIRRFPPCESARTSRRPARTRPISSPCRCWATGWTASSGTAARWSGSAT